MKSACILYQPLRPIFVALSRKTEATARNSIPCIIMSKLCRPTIKDNSARCAPNRNVNSKFANRRSACLLLIMSKQTSSQNTWSSLFTPPFTHQISTIWPICDRHCIPFDSIFTTSYIEASAIAHVPIPSTRAMSTSSTFVAVFFAPDPSRQPCQTPGLPRVRRTFHRQTFQTHRARHSHHISQSSRSSIGA